MLVVLKYDPYTYATTIKMSSGQGYVIRGKHNALLAYDTLWCPRIFERDITLSEVYNRLRDAGISSKRIVSI